MSVTPIKPGIEPRLDIEREIIDYLSGKVREYVAEHGEPYSVALVLIAPDKGGSTSEAYSWAPANDTSATLRTCATAAVLLTKRALGL